MSNGSMVTNIVANEGKQKSFPIGQKFQSPEDGRQYMVCMYTMYGNSKGELCIVLLDEGRILQNFPNMSEFVDYIHTETNLVPI